MLNINKIIRIIVAAITAAAACNASALNIHDSNSGLVLEGEIKSGDYAKLIRYLRTDDKHLYQFLIAIQLDSPGGDVVEAVRIGNLIKTSYGETVVMQGGRCFSACVILWASGVSRSMHNDGKLGVHRISLTGDEISVAKNDNAVRPIADGVETYLLKMGMPRKIVDKMNETSPTDLFVFDNRWLIQEDLENAVGYLPAFIDVAERKCGVDPFVKAGKTGARIDKQNAYKWINCVENVRQQNQNLDIKKIGALIYDFNTVSAASVQDENNSAESTPGLKKKKKRKQPVDN